MPKLFRTGFLALLCVSLIAATEPRQPTGRWVVNFDDAQCFASRDYGTKDRPLQLVLKTPPAGNIIQIGIIRPAKGGKPEQLDAELIIDQQEPLRTSMLAFTAKGQKAYLINLPTQDFAPARTAQVITIRTKGQLDEQLAVSTIGSLMKVMDDCVADLRKVWNVPDAEGDNTKLKEQASGNVQGLIRANDYPGVALDKSQSGTATLAFLIDETGRIADCTVIGTSGAASLDAQSCGILKARAKFKPAVGWDGKPAKDSFVQRITWRVEE